MAETKQQEKPKQKRKRSPKVQDAALAAEVAEQKARLERVQRLATVKEKVAKLTTDMSLDDLKDLIVYLGRRRGVVMTFEEESSSPDPLEGNGLSAALG